VDIQTETTYNSLHVICIATILYRVNADPYAKEIQFCTEYRQHNNLLLEGMYHFVVQNKIYIRIDDDAIVRSVAWVNVVLHQIHIQRLRTDGAFVTKSEKLSNHIITNAKTCADC